MDVIRYLLERKLLAFVLATLLVQMTVIIVGFSLKYSAPEIDAEQLMSQLSEQEYELSEHDLSEHLNQPLNQLGDASESINPEASVRTVAHRIRSGETLSNLWTKYTNDASAAIDAFDAFKSAGIGVSDLRVGLVADITIEDGQISQFELELKDARKINLQLHEDGGYKANLAQPEIIEQERTISGIINSSFAATASEKQIPYQVVDQLVDLFSAKIEFRRDVQVGDSFSVMYTERKLADGRILEPGSVKGASFRNNGKWMAAVAHINSNGEVVFYNDQGQPLGEFFLRYPLKFSRISSVFNTARFHPILKRVRPHNGVDFAAPIGTPVRSVGDGIVQDAGYRGGAGNMIKIKHNDKYTTAYLHLHTISAGARRGQRVTKGQVIGTVGRTGTATGPHLHFSLYVNGAYKDPMKADLPQIANGGKPIPKDYLDGVMLALKTSEENLQLVLNNATQPEQEIG